VADSPQNIFNPSRLTLARKRRGLTKGLLAKRILVDLRTITSYEAGEHAPAQDTMAALRIALEFPESFFYGEDMEEPMPETASFRALTRMTARQRDMALSQGAIALHFNKWLEERFDMPVATLPDLSREHNPEMAAESLRRVWGIGKLSIRNLIHLLEANGVRVFSLALETKEVDAFSMWKGNVPFIFLNTYKTAEHSRFDAAHELGHLVLHKHGGPHGRETEKEADAFASAFLMPAESVVANAPRFTTVSDLIKLKKVWGTSVSALAYRLHVLKMLSDWHYQGICVQLSRNGFRTSEPESIPRESSLVLPKLLETLYVEDGLTRSKIADALAIPVSELEQLLFSLVMTGVQGGRSAGTPKGARSNLYRIK